MGDEEKSLSNFLSSLKISLEINGNTHSTTANIYNNIGSVYEGLKDYDKSINYC